MISRGVQKPLPPPPLSLDPRSSFSVFPTLLWYVYFSTLLRPPPPPPPEGNTCTILQFMYIYHFLVSRNGREFDYWHTNRVGSVLSAAHTFYVTPTSQCACALALMSPFSTVSVFYVTPGCNSIADLSLKIVFWTHKFAVGTH